MTEFYIRRRLLLLPAVICAFMSFRVLAGEWEDYLASKYQSYLWNSMVADGHVAYAKKDYKTALSEYEKAVEKGCRDPITLFRMGYSHRELGDEAKAAGYFKLSADELKDYKPDHQYHWMARYYLARFYLSDEQYVNAAWEAEQAVTLKPDNGEIHLLYGNIYLRQNKPALAIDRFRKGHEVDPENPRLLIAIGTAAEELKDYSLALEAYKKALKAEPGNESASMRLGNFHLNRGELDNALEYYLNAIKTNEENISALASAGRIHWLKREFDRSADYYERVLMIDTDNMDATFNLGNAKLAQGKGEEARKLFEKVIEKNPEHRDAHYNLGAIHLSAKRYREAIEEYAKVIAIDPEDESAYYNIAVVFVRQGRYTEAKEYLNKSIAHFGQKTRWGRAAQALLDIILQIESGKEAELEKALEILDFNSD